MKATPLTQKSINSIGEEIDHELGKQMVADYQIAHSADVHFYLIGRNIIDQILSQPGCDGIKFFNAYNEVGEKTLVYTGIDSHGKTIIEYTTVSSDGLLESNKGIVADRTERGGGTRDQGTLADDWNWDVA